MTKSTVTKLDNGGMDVQFEGGGRVILNANEAKTEAEARTVASERLQLGGRVGDDDSTPSTADTPKASAKRTRSKSSK